MIGRFAVAALAIIASAESARACSCALMPFPKALREADLVVIGVADDKAVASKKAPIAVKVEETLRDGKTIAPAKAAETIEVAQPSGVRRMCLGGFSGKAGERTLLLLKREKKGGYSLGGACYPSIYVLDRDVFHIYEQGPGGPLTRSLAEVRGLLAEPGK